MKVSDIMTKNVIKVSPEESVEVAARALTHYNIGALPVCGSDGRLCGVVSLGDMAVREESVMDAGDALADISSNLSMR